MSLDPVRRIITGVGADGRSRFIADTPAPVSQTVAGRPGYVVSNIWVTRLGEGPDTPDASAAHRGISPPDRGTVLRTVEFPPEPKDPEAKARMMAATFGSIFQDADHRGKAAGHPGMHVTQTVDYAIVLDGEIWAIMDDEETLMKAGDILVQRGTNHAWANRSGAPARIAFILIDAKT